MLSHYCITGLQTKPCSEEAKLINLGPPLNDMAIPMEHCSLRVKGEKGEIHRYVPG